MIKVVLLAPINNSLYARLVAYGLTKEKDVELAGIIVRSHWNIQRFRSEFSRDGARLIKKIYQKLVVGDKRFSGQEANNLAALAQQWRLPYKSLKEIAQSLNIPYHVVPDHNHPNSLQMLQGLKLDVILFTGGGLLRKPLLEIPRLGILNCHTGILPQYRGMDVVEWTAAEERINSVGFGATLHFMDRGVDTGPILMKKTIAPKKGATFEIIRAELETVMVELMIEGVRGLQAGTLTPQLQNPEEGRQFFVMHPRVKASAEDRLVKQN
ncbi:MAG: formyltransferase family protein [Pelolinea sp.]|nr:formyltransferase family protein [Pelolinea sp.]